MASKPLNLHTILTEFNGAKRVEIVTVRYTELSPTRFKNLWRD
jgi:hypothetical protein